MAQHAVEKDLFLSSMTQRLGRRKTMTRSRLNELNYRKVLPGCTQYALIFSGVFTRKYGMVQNILVPKGLRNSDAFGRLKLIIIYP